MVKVLVTGATGRTGSIVLKELQKRGHYLLDQDEIEAVGFARSPEKVQDLFGETAGFAFGNINDPESLQAAMVGLDVLIILTSAMPQVSPPSELGQPPQCTFESGGTPEEVDYQGQLNQINCAKAAGVRHIILVGSMGGTNEQHPLNNFGKILIWKRKAEQYLIDSGVDYTIIRAGGLMDEPGGRELLVGKDDELLRSPPNGMSTTISRADVAEVVMQALVYPNAKNKAFDVIAGSDQVAVENRDFSALFDQTTGGL